MKTTFSDVAADALKLTPPDQVRLARVLLERLEAHGDLGAEEAWENEIERRIKLIDSGLAKGIPFDEALRAVDAALRR